MKAFCHIICYFVPYQAFKLSYTQKKCYTSMQSYLFFSIFYTYIFRYRFPVKALYIFQYFSSKVFHIFKTLRKLSSKYFINIYIFPFFPFFKNFSYNPIYRMNGQLKNKTYYVKLTFLLYLC